MEDEVEFAGLSMRKEALLAWIFRLLLLVALLWGNSHFVSRAEYADDKKLSDDRRETFTKSLYQVNDTLTRIDEKMKNDVRQDEELKDHESRLRDIEKTKGDR